MYINLLFSIKIKKTNFIVIIVFVWKGYQNSMPGNIRSYDYYQIQNA